MPIQIRELIIKANVNSNQKAATNSASGESQKEEIVKACVEQVLEILKMQKQR